MYCGSCGKALSSDASFCTNCGAAVSNTADIRAQPLPSAPLPPASPAATSPSPEPGAKIFTGFKVPKWARALAILVLLLLFTAVLEQFWEGLREALRAADNFFRHGVKSAAPFHLCVLFYRDIMDGLSSSSQSANANLGTIIALAIGAAFHVLGTIFQEGPASVLTAAIVLFVGISITFDRKADHPFLTTLFLAPVVGGCFLYVLLLLMLLFSTVFLAGAEAITFVVANSWVLKQCWSILLEAKEHEIAERIVDRLARKFE